MNSVQGFSLAFDQPLALWLALAAMLPLWRNAHLRSPWPRLVDTMRDTASGLIERLLRGAAALALATLAVAVAGPYRPDSEVVRIGSGAHLVLLIDRSASMNDSFAGRTPVGGAESKAAAAKRLLQGFAGRRAHDRIGVVAFSTMPMLVLPLTAQQQAVQAAIGAIDRSGLAYTDVGRGLAMALTLFGSDSGPSVSRAILIVSDGAAVIDRRVQDKLRADIAMRPVQIYWLFLRTAGSPGIHDEPRDGVPDNPQTMPERHLDIFFKSLGVAYRAFEASSADEVAQVIEEIDREQQRPLRYLERVPRVDLRDYALAIACLCLILLIAAKLVEVQVRRREEQ